MNVYTIRLNRLAVCYLWGAYNQVDASHTTHSIINNNLNNLGMESTQPHQIQFNAVEFDCGLCLMEWSYPSFLHSIKKRINFMNLLIERWVKWFFSCRLPLHSTIKIVRIAGCGLCVVAQTALPSISLSLSINPSIFLFILLSLFELINWVVVFACLLALCAHNQQTRKLKEMKFLLLERPWARAPREANQRQQKTIHFINKEKSNKFNFSLLIHELKD